MNVSSAQQVLAAHTYELCHTAFICMKYKRYKNVRAVQALGREARVLDGIFESLNWTLLIGY